MVLAGTLSTGGCVGFLPLFETMSGWVVCESLMGWWRCPGWWLAGWPLLGLQSSSLSWAKAPSLSSLLPLSSLSGIRGGGPSLSQSLSGGLLMGSGYGASMERVVERMGVLP